MDWTTISDVIAAVCLLLGAFLTLVAGLGLLRLPDLLSRMHAATKPQVLGLCLMLTGLAFRLRDPEVVLLLALVCLFQLITSPVANHMVARAAVRAGQADRERLIVDDLTPVLEDFNEPRGAP